MKKNRQKYCFLYFILYIYKNFHSKFEILGYEFFYKIMYENFVPHCTYIEIYINLLLLATEVTSFLFERKKIFWVDAKHGNKIVSSYSLFISWWYLYACQILPFVEITRKRWERPLFEGKMKRRMSIESVTSKNCGLQKVFTLE